MPDTLLLLATETLDAARTDAGNARADLADANQDVQAARADIERLSADLAALLEAAARIREDLAATTDHAEGEVLLGDLDENRRGQHRVQAELIGRRLEHDNTRATAARAAAELARAQARIDAAPAAIKAAEEAATRRAAWLAIAATLTPTLASDAAAVKAGPTWIAARDRVAGEIPAVLHTAGHDRAVAFHQEMADLATDAAGAEEDLHDLHEAHDTTAGAPGNAEARRIEFARAERALAELANRAANDLAGARAALENLVAEAALTPAVRQRITDLAADGGAAVPQVDAKRQQRDDALAEVLRLRAGLEDLEERRAGGETGLDAQIDGVRAELATAEATYQAAKTAYEEVFGAAEAWIASIPDAAWKRFAAFEEATRTLDRLAATPATIAADLAAAEKNLANALAATDADARNIETAAEAADEAHRVLAAAEEARPARLLATIRGDN